MSLEQPLVGLWSGAPVGPQTGVSVGRQVPMPAPHWLLCSIFISCTHCCHRSGNAHYRIREHGESHMTAWVCSIIGVPAFPLPNSSLLNYPSFL